MPRLISATGVLVNVSDDKAERLLAGGTFTPAGDEPAGVAPAPKAAVTSPPAKRAVTKAAAKPPVEKN